MTHLVLCPLPQERDGFLAECQAQGLAAEPVRLGRLPAVRLPGLDALVAVGGVGKAQYALQAQHALEAGGPWEALVCAGTAGALAPTLQIGDVVVATTTIEHDYKVRLVKLPQPRFEAAPALLDALRGVPGAAGGFAVHFGAVASGDEDIADAERRAELARETRALAAAWEGAGGARAAAFNQVPFVELRGVSDAADQGAPAAFANNLTQAMRHIARFVIAWRQHTHG